MFDKSRAVPEALYDWIVCKIEAVLVDCSWIGEVGLPGDFAVTGVEISEDIWFFPVGSVPVGSVPVGLVSVVLAPVGLPGKKDESVLNTRHFSVRFFEEVSISVEHGAVETKEAISDHTEEVVSQETFPEEREEQLEGIPPEETEEENLEIVPEEIAEEALEDMAPEERDGEIELVSEFDIVFDEVGKSWVKDGIWIVIVLVPPGAAVYVMVFIPGPNQMSVLVILGVGAAIMTVPSSPCSPRTINVVVAEPSHVEVIVIPATTAADAEKLTEFHTKFIFLTSTYTATNGGTIPNMYLLWI